MQLTDLIATLNPLKVYGAPAATVTGICYDSRRVVAGGAFFALPGAHTDGRLFIADAIARGAAVIVAEAEIDLPGSVAGIVVENARLAMAHAAAARFNHPTRDVPVIGVTGTNGKTTVTYLLESILRVAGYRPAVLGTVNYRFEQEQRPAPHTTPEAVDLLGTFSEFRAQGADALIIEVSSHALTQHRVSGVEFTVGVFTNLSPEHLDYHQNMDNYFAAKRILFDDLLAQSGGRSVVNGEDPFGARLAREIRAFITCGAGGNVSVHDAEISLDGIRGTLRTPTGEAPLSSQLLGDFNRSNIECAAGAAVALGIAAETIAAGILAAHQVPGRLERIENSLGAEILVDYAHTGDALEQVLKTLRKLQPRRLLVVFGCGGDRDRKKRPEMGECVARHADLAILTSDNPRSEDPEAILQDVRCGIERVHDHELTVDEARAGRNQGYLSFVDRRAAIEFAVSLLKSGELLLIAGKGHEDYQLIGGERRHFDDREEARAALARREMKRCR